MLDSGADGERLKNINAWLLRREGDCIGLNTCRRILRMLNGSFETGESDGIFTAELRLPLF